VVSDGNYAGLSQRFLAQSEIGSEVNSERSYGHSHSRSRNGHSNYYYSYNYNYSSDYSGTSEPISMKGFFIGLGVLIVYVIYLLVQWGLKK
jgi:hypothetical protein